MNLIGLLLLGTWLLTWYLFLVRFAPAAPKAARAHLPFALLTHATFFALGCWSVLAWASAVVPQDTEQWLVAFAGVAVATLGQVLMVAARKALPLGNYDLVFALARREVRSGVYRWCNHPMYLGLFAALCGTSLALLSMPSLFLLLPLAALLALRAYVEYRA